MLIKEYRIPLPLTVDEYKIAQLYMIAKKSRQESKVGPNSKIQLFAQKCNKRTWSDTRTTDTRRGNGLHCPVENPLPLPNF